MMGSVNRRASSPIFVGRRPELERLEMALEAATSGRPLLVLVAGEAGVGKSRLMIELASRARARGVRTLAGACLDVGGGLPFAPFAEALNTLVRDLGRESEVTVATVFGSSERDLALLLSELRKVAPANERPIDMPDQASRQARLFDAVLDVLGRLASLSPVLLVLEDMHWADGSTRDLLRFLVRNIRDEAVLLVGTYRSDDLHRRHPLTRLLSELERSNLVDRLDVVPFDRAEVLEQATAILGHQPSPATLDSLVDRSDGLPFYVEELLATDAAGAVSGSLRDIVGLSLAALPDQSVPLVRAAAVIGGPFTLDRLAAVAGLDEAALLPALRGATEASVLVPEDGPGEAKYGFRHALLREAAYEDLLPAERTRFHLRLADHLAGALATATDDEPALIADFATHTFQAGHQPRALVAAVRAVRTLAESGAFREALEHVAHALELWPHVIDPEARSGMSHGELLALAAQVGMSAGVPGPALAHATAALDELEPSATTERLAALLIEIYDIAFAAETFDAAWAAARRLHGLLDQLPPSRLLVDALAVLGDERAVSGHGREAIEITNRSMTVARSLGDDRAWAAAVRASAQAQALLGWISQAETLIDAAAVLPPAFDGTPRSFAGVLETCWVQWLAGRFAESGHAAAELGRVATRYGVERRYAPWYLAVQAEAAFELGRLDEAERLARSAGEHMWTGSWRTIAKVAAVRGLLDAARAASRPDCMGDPMWRLEAQAFIERAAGDFDRVRARIEEAEAARTTTDIVPPLCRLLGTGIGAAADRAVAARRRRHIVDAAEMSRLGTEWFAWLQAILDDAQANGGAGRFVEATLATAAAECQRLRGTFDPLTWAKAAGQWRALLDPYETAYAELRLAEALLQTDGDRAEVARLLRGAHAVTIGLGGAPLRSEVETVARHARVQLVPEPAEATSGGAGPPAQQSAGPTLTARERGVLRLVADGHTNREIAERLFISEKTASVHVSNAMAKLGALSRYEAAAAADRAGQLD